MMALVQQPARAPQRLQDFGLPAKALQTEDQVVDALLHLVQYLVFVLGLCRLAPDLRLWYSSPPVGLHRGRLDRLGRPRRLRPPSTMTRAWASRRPPHRPRTRLRTASCPSAPDPFGS